MKLVSVRVRNFRCYQEELAVDIGKITALIGKNDAGKSSILEALKIFFDDEKPDANDASINGDRRNVRIICEFSDLPSSIVIDSDFETSLANEYLLNARGHLEIHKVFNCDIASPKLLGVFAVAEHPSKDRYDDLLGLKLADLKTRATSLGLTLDGVRKTIKASVRNHIWSSEPDLRLQTTEIPLNAEAGKDIWDQIQKRLPVFALFKSDRASTDQDPEAQDPMKSAVKEAIRKREAELLEIASHVEAEVRSIAERTVRKISEMDPTLATTLTPQFQAVKWDSVFKMSLTGDEEIPINKRGSGVRRLILLNFFRAKAEERSADSDGAGIIYAIEEPETSQHPNNQTMLLDAFLDLAEQAGTQVVLTTHTPMLGRRLPADALRFIEHSPGQPRRVLTDSDATRRRIADALGVLPDHSVKVFIGVEGRHDISFLQQMSQALRLAGEDIPDLLLLEKEGKIVFVPLGGSSLGLWASRLAGLNRPELYLCDRDVAPPEPPKYAAFMDEVNKRTGCQALATEKREMENYLHPDAIAKASLALHGQAMRLSFGDFCDVPELAAKELHSRVSGATAWDELTEEKQEKKVSQAKRWLNNEAAGQMTPDLLDERDSRREVRTWFSLIADKLL